MKIIFVCRSFNKMAGGVEKMSIALMNAMCNRGHTVHLLTWDLPDEANPFFEMDHRIIWHKIGLGNHNQKAGLIIKVRRFFKIRSIIRKIKPSVGIGFQHGPFVAVKIYTLGLGLPMICAERNALDRMKYNDRIENKNFVFQSMRLASSITIQCQSFFKSYPSFLHKRIVTIPNPVFPQSVHAMPQGQAGDRKKLLTVGRLAYQKNFECLIRSFARIATSHPNWDLVIIGDGEKYQALKDQIEHLNLSSRIHLKGALPSEQVMQHYVTAHLFCLPSRWEGFPNVLAESLSHGLPAVGFSECPGVRDLIISGVNGLLAAGIDDEQTLAAALSDMMDHDQKRLEMGRAALDSVKPYQPEKIFTMWEDLFTRLAHRSIS